MPNSLPFQKALLAEVGVEGTNISSSSRKRPEWVCRASAGKEGKPQWQGGQAALLPSHPGVPGQLSRHTSTVFPASPP